MKKIFDINVGDQVWLMHGNSAVCATVTKARYTKFISCVDYESIVESEAYSVSVNDKPLYESYKKEQLFPTKADLINSL
jgi:hypothetical protein